MEIWPKIYSKMAASSILNFQKYYNFNPCDMWIANINWPLIELCQLLNT